MRHPNSKWTPAEKRVVQKLSNASGRIVPISEILETISRGRRNCSPSTVPVYLSRVRKKLTGKFHIVRITGYALMEKPTKREMNVQEKKLFKFFQDSDGVVVTTEQVADFLQLKAKNPNARHGAANRKIALLRKVMPTQYVIVTIRHLGFAFREKTAPKQPIISAEISSFT